MKVFRLEPGYHGNPDKAPHLLRIFQGIFAPESLFP